MASELIAKALETATDTKAIAFGDGVLDDTGRLFAECFPGRRGIIVADDNTWAVAGEQVDASLRAAGVDLDEPYVFPGTPTLYAGYDNVELLRQHLRGTDAVACSIASGTLNDITKLASGELQRPYLNVCTAASMDGYASFGASITRDGFKITRTCPAPAALVAPLDIMAVAPSRLTATGYGDLIEKVPAGADWIIADTLGLDPIDEAVWALVQHPLRAALADPAGVAAGDHDAIAGLSEGLLMSGLAMQAHQSSRPASGAGHNFSHQWEMEGHGQHWDPPLSHGMKVGLGTIAVCALYEQVQRLDLTTLDVDARLASWLTPEQDAARVAALQDVPVMQEAALTQSRAKYLPVERAEQRLTAIKEAWPTILERIAPQLLSADEVASMIATVGGVHHPSQIDIGFAKLKRTYYQAQTIRNRYTVLDLLVEVGLLGDVVEGLFAPGGYWAGRPTP